MIKKLELQYNSFSNDFIKGAEIYNEISTNAYYSVLENINFSKKKVLDIGCGNGLDIEEIIKRNGICHGIDSSKVFVKKSQDRNSSAKIINAKMESLPYKDNSFDIILSRYAIQNSKDVPLALSEMDRVLKPNGIITYLAAHPLRQFLEKKKHPKDYFIQEVVNSVFFGGIMSVAEPTHTFNEYLNPNFLKKYKLLHFQEYKDFPSSEKIDNDEYPCFFIIKAKKR